MTLGAYGYIDEATYWPAPQETGYGGIEFGAPKIIMTKWEDSVEQITDNTGQEAVSKSRVFVMEHLDEGGYLAKGNHLTVEDPSSLNKADYIRRVDYSRDLRGLHEEITCYL